ncbi:hypothetical protein NKT77_00090 [Moraxella sp. FZLJ2107]|uniref:hypothetical protein n=1 Tax=unclassified Moraxella TaxID=2685852 RepID=UPI0020C85C95|nr:MULTISPECIES: hypothetical protein [unclassified Moraxella]UTO05104.1 hypothetical protein NKT77_00090 [Moraxella sp. FZLJ2107]UTO21839.1 hypothetical protein NKU06_08390 [Moraxella sp. FZLJ2109]
MKKFALILATMSILTACQSTNGVNHNGLKITKKDGVTTAVPTTAPKHSKPSADALEYAPQVAQNATAGSLIILFEPSAKDAVLELVKRRGDTLLYEYKNISGIAIQPMYHSIEPTISSYKKINGVLGVTKSQVHQIGLPNVQ